MIANSISIYMILFKGVWYQYMRDTELFADEGIDVKEWYQYICNTIIIGRNWYQYMRDTN